MNRSMALAVWVAVCVNCRASSVARRATSVAFLDFFFGFVFAEGARDDGSDENEDAEDDEALKRIQPSSLCIVSVCSLVGGRMVGRRGLPNRPVTPAKKRVPHRWCPEATQWHSR
jgi:hypothetical protein